MGLLSELSFLFLGEDVDDKLWFPKCIEIWKKTHNDNGTDIPLSEYKAENNLDCIIETETYNLREDGYNGKPIGTKIVHENGSVYHCDPDKDSDRWRYMMTKVRFHDIARVVSWHDGMGITVFCKNGVVFKKKMPDPFGCIRAFNEYLASVPKQKVEIW